MSIPIHRRHRRHRSYRLPVSRRRHRRSILDIDNRHLRRSKRRRDQERLRRGARLKLRAYRADNADEVPDGAVSYSAAFNFLKLAPGRSYIVKMYAVDTNDNITSREEYTEIVDVTAPVINELNVTSPVSGQLKVDVNVTDDSGGAGFCSASLYWIFTPDIELDYYYIELIDRAGSVTFTDLEPERTYIVELLVRDPSRNSKYESWEGYPNGIMG